LFENKLLRNIFGERKNEVSGKFCLLPDHDLYDTYESSSTVGIVRNLEGFEMCWSRGQDGNAFGSLVEMPVQKHPL
jgi:hypothetical protein